MQLRVSAECGQAWPPKVGAALLRSRFWEPPLQELVQADHVLKAPTPQSVAQGAALQARVSAECGHAAPPSVGSTVARLRLCEPVPHDLVQVDQALKADTTQLTAHGCELHERTSELCGHAAPPNVGATCERLRFCQDVPQETGHVDQALKVPIAQSMAHVWLLQLRVSSRYGHT